MVRHCMLRAAVIDLGVVRLSRSLRHVFVVGVAWRLNDIEKSMSKSLGSPVKIRMQVSKSYADGIEAIVKEM